MNEKELRKKVEKKIGSIPDVYWDFISADVRDFANERNKYSQTDANEIIKFARDNQPSIQKPRALKSKSKEKLASLGSGRIKAIFRPVRIRPPYVLEEKVIYNNTEDHPPPGSEVNIRMLVIVEKGKSESKQISINNIPDLFIKFAELDETPEAYLSFVSSYGPLGLKTLYPEMSEYFNDDEEPIFSIQDFHKTFKQAFGWVKDYIYKKNTPFEELLDVIYVGPDKRQQRVKAPVEYSIEQYFKWALNCSGITYKTSSYLTGELTYYGWSLASSLILQLYRYLLVGKPLRVCALPECQNLTTTKYCSDEHGDTFRHRLERGTIDKEGNILKLTRKYTRKEVINNGKHSKAKQKGRT